MLYISELCEDCAVTNEIDYETDDAWTSIHGIHDNGPVDHGVWRLTLTAYKHLSNLSNYTEYMHLSIYLSIYIVSILLSRSTVYAIYFAYRYFHNLD